MGATPHPHGVHLEVFPEIYWYTYHKRLPVSIEKSGRSFLTFWALSAFAARWGLVSECGTHFGPIQG